MSKPIYFYETNEPYGCFSNFSKHSIVLNEKVWPTTEHYFQAHKFSGTEHEDLIHAAATAMEAARLGRERSRPLRSDWECIKDDVMKKALLARFTQHDDLLEALMKTGQREIIEHTKNDSYWADGWDGSGQNMLGKLLMQIREELQ